MSISQTKAVLLFVLFFAAFCHAGKMYVVLLAGQSNMAGRGIIRIPDDTITYGNILSLNKDSVWVRARHPVHWDKGTAGVGMGISFARELSGLLKSNDTIGLVPCAAGGTSINNWLDNMYFAYTGNFYLYSNLINRARKAARSGAIIGMIWHQGESDATPALYATYQNNLKTLFDRIRTDLELPDMPIVAGEIGRFLVNNSTYPRWDSINAAINNLKNVLQHYAVASSSGLVSNSDITHFNSASQDTFGIRYARLFFPLINSTHAEKSPIRTTGHFQIKVTRNGIQLQQDFPTAAEIYFYDLSGRLVKTATVSETKNQITTDDLSGLFLLKITSGQKTHFQKIIQIQ